MVECSYNGTDKAYNYALMEEMEDPYFDRDDYYTRKEIINMNIKKATVDKFIKKVNILSGNNIKYGRVNGRVVMHYPKHTVDKCVKRYVRDLNRRMNKNKKQYKSVVYVHKYDRNGLHHKYNLDVLKDRYPTSKVLVVENAYGLSELINEISGGITEVIIPHESNIDKQTLEILNRSVLKVTINIPYYHL
jgi:hypothetical protein